LRQASARAGENYADALCLDPWSLFPAGFYFIWFEGLNRHQIFRLARWNGYHESPVCDIMIC